MKNMKRPTSPKSREHSSIIESFLSNEERNFIGRKRRYILFKNSLTKQAKDHVSYRFISMSVLTGTMMVAEVVVGVMTGSLTLLSDALHMLSDFIALIIAYIAQQMTQKGNDPDSLEHSMVFMRYEVVGALINGTVLLTSCFIMGLEAIQRMAFMTEGIENVDLVLIVGGLGLFINLVGLFIFGHHGHDHGHGGEPASGNVSDVEHDDAADHEHAHSDHDHVDDHEHGDSHGHDHEHDHGHDHNHGHGHGHGGGGGHSHGNMNIHGVFLHILSDLLGSIAVMISSLIIKYTDGPWTLYVDPACTLFMVILISKTAWPLVRQSIDILLDKSPFSEEQLQEMQDALCDIKGVLNVHEFHCWEVKPGYNMATVHLVIDPEFEDHDHTAKYCDKLCLIVHDKMTIIDHAKEVLHKYCVHSSIVQSEFPAKGDLIWQQSDDPCFDFVCDERHCIPKSKALSNSSKNLKANVLLEVVEQKEDQEQKDDNENVNDAESSAS